ncbi:hypothetical protein A5773_04185 [Mycobacterium sp. 852014-52450_SCH5900713]|uniref:hypothetical protein n=1 Tax=Mycobacterium sp. 852014-52450_SCH5900713 TaxID=1834116 RepID=UPI0007FBDB2D|nr:hypothetical protein [Mycobacterium sp. 852014-52450_SCH5900713]OBG00693.1 hypothetical protein A5773_04185 [Mycobacterium sp. 852014-52450_SCH5900713]
MTAATTATIATRPAASTTAKVTADEIDTAILAALADAGGAQRSVRWTTIERRIPGTVWQQECALVRLWNAERIYAVKVGRHLLLELSSPIDAMIAAKRGRTARVMPVVP